MRRSHAILAVAAAAATLSNPLAAQTRSGRDRGIVEVAPPGLRHGLYVTGALGDGREQYKYSDDPLGYTDVLEKPAAALRIGGTPSQSVRLGGELFGWWNNTPDGTESFSTALLSAQFYPLLRSGLYVKAGGGFARSAINFNNGFTTAETGFGWSVGAGWEFELSRSIALGPTVDLYQGSFTQRGRDQNGNPNPTLTERVVNLGIAITFQTSGRRYR